MKMKRFFCILLCFILVLGMSGTAFAGTEIYTNLIPTSTDDEDTLTSKQVTFNGKKWHIIADNSTSDTEGTVTLLAAESLGKSAFDSSGTNNKYSISTVKTFLESLTAENGSFASVASAINTVRVKGSNADTEVEVKLYLLSRSVARSLPDNVKKLVTNWWLRYPGSSNTTALRLHLDGGTVKESSRDVTTSLSVRPALQLNLSSVIFSSKTFKLLSKITTNPKSKSLTDTGSAQELITAGSAEGGTMQYALGKDDKTAPTSGWSTSIPKGTDAGTYYVWYKVIGDENHTDTTPVCISVTIAGRKITYVVAFVDNGVHEIGDQKDCRITVRSEPDGSKAYDNYQNTRMDAQVMPNGSHTAEKGSLIVTLKAAYLDTLAIGKHKATINFKDGSVDVEITVKEGYVVPKTGDSANPALWLAMMLVALIGFAGLAVTGTMKASRKKK